MTIELYLVLSSHEDSGIKGGAKVLKKVWSPWKETITSQLPGKHLRQNQKAHQVPSASSLVELLPHCQHKFTKALTKTGPLILEQSFALDCSSGIGNKESEKIATKRVGHVFVNHCPSRGAWA